ncbi:dihydrofolate reductase family protein [Nonomuraea sp. JJY05]|uniref:dihydrofolate reductase family protein n=1 Tax=Nonomuraea sp. JJY05 TaxID=3350255 RepID=UPI00373DFB6B
MTRKLTVAALLTLDGVHAEPRSFAGPYFDDAAAARSLATLQSCDAMLMGRTTYEYFAPAWSAAPGAYAERINAIGKYVFSSTLVRVDWSNTTLVAGDPAETVAELKQQPGGDLMIYGFGRLPRSLLEHDLVDELVFTVFPVIAGTGTPLFRPGQQAQLELMSTKAEPTGAVELTYRRRR